MINTVILLVLAGSLVPIEELYPQLFTLTGARLEPANFFEKLCVRNMESRLALQYQNDLYVALCAFTFICFSSPALGKCFERIML